MTSSIICLDVGGTKIRYGRVEQGLALNCNTILLGDHSDENKLLAQLIKCIQQLFTANCKAIAIGIPSIVDIDKGIVYDSLNVAAWQQYPLKEKLENHFALPVYLNNDVNCFVAGEVHYGQTAKGLEHVVGVCLGTGFGAGFVLNGRLHTGNNCCTGELGNLPYLDGTLDDYCSGTFFLQHYQKTGDQLAEQARNGDLDASAAFEKFGKHLADAISSIMLMVDPQIIIIGGSVAHSFDLFIDSVWENLNRFPYKRVKDNLQIVKSELQDAALLGAAVLCSQQSNMLITE